ncbi:MAG TPA: tRNA-dihydrouridine synthase family protein [Clostridia bacterium]|nr:tRNA-dihydrouridine synthase family protein [Clostridia bacterium]
MTKKQLPLFSSDLFLAPLAGYSDQGMRQLSYSYGAGLCFTEMVSAKGLHYGNENTTQILHTSDTEKGKTAVQLFGSEPNIIEEVVGMDALKEFPIIDINMGCPVPKIVNNGEGCSLMKNPYLVKDIVSAAVRGANGKHISAKFRAGFSSSTVNAVEIAQACMEGGASFVTVHGRTRDKYYSGDVDFELIRKVSESVNIPVVGNGSVNDRDSYLKMKEYCGVDFVMVARGAIGKPYIFSEIKNLQFNYNITEAIKIHIENLSYLPERIVVNNMKKHIAYYVKGQINQKYIKEQIFKCYELKEMLSIIDNANLK